MRKLVIADPSLTDHRGHHYLLTTLVSNAARDAGFEVVWLVNQEFEIALIDPFVDIRPVYSFTMYDKYRAVADQTLKLKTSVETTKEIIDSLNDIGLTEEDHVLFHTTFYDIFEAFLRFFSMGGKASSPVIHLCTPYDENTMPGRPDDTAVSALLMQFAKLHEIESRLYLWAETPQLADHYRDILHINVYSLPLPVTNEIEKESPAKSIDDESRVKVVYLGAAREEKGFTLLPELVSLCYENDNTRKRLKFTIQATPQIVGYNDKILDAIDRLGSFSDDFVVLIRQSLDESTYHDLLRKSDIVLLLYDESNYKIRGSGIAVEAVSLGKCLIATKGTFCHSLIDRGGGVGVKTPQEAFDFIEQYIQQPGLFKIRGKQQAFFYNIQNSGQRYLDRLVYRHIAGNRKWLRPSGHIRQLDPLLVQ